MDASPRVVTPERSRHWYTAPQPEDDASSHRLRLAIGVIGVTLPLLLWLVARWRSVQGEPGWRFLDSISAYFYSGAGPLFVGALAVLALFLWTYKGFLNDKGRLDRRVAKVASVAAFLVSFFPTEPIPRASGPGWWACWMNPVHFTAAAVLFTCFAVFSIWLFPTRGANPGNDPGKTRRNTIYFGCGAGIAMSLVWALIGHLHGLPIVGQETAALKFFGVSWLVKGRADFTVKEVVRQGPRRMEEAVRRIRRR